jgi:hypothetical protein
LEFGGKTASENFFLDKEFSPCLNSQKSKEADSMDRPLIVKNFGWWFYYYFGGVCPSAKMT